MAETFPNERLLSGTPEHYLGDLALQEQQGRKPFEVSDEELLALVPGIASVEASVRDFVVAVDPNVYQSDVEEPVGAETSRPSRDNRRKGAARYGRYMARIIRTGAMYLASFSDHEEAVRAGRVIFDPEWDEALGDMYDKRIVASSVPLRNLLQASQTVCSQIKELATENNTTATSNSYTLLKILATQKENWQQDDKPSLDDLSLPALLHGAIAIEGQTDVKTFLGTQAQKGLFDRHIAYDLLQFVDGNKVDGDLERIRQLATFLHAFLGDNQPDKTALHGRMANLLGSWPISQQQIVIEARQAMLGRLEANLTRMERTIKESDLKTTGDHEAAFINSFDRFAQQVTNQAAITPDNKAEVMAARAQYRKRGRVTPKRQPKSAAKPLDLAATPEARREPLKLVTCNLNDYSIVEGVEGLVDQFLEGISQRDTALRDDLLRILNFMARTDLPLDHRRGVKRINEGKVKFGIDEDPDKLWDFFEMKPTEAAGLPTSTGIAKDLRVYFIKMNKTTLGIIGIKERSKQDEFLKTVRVKTKRRG